MAAIDKVTPVRALALALALSALNPKNLTLSLAGGVTIGGADLTTYETVTALAVFVAIGSSTVVVPVVGYLVARNRVAQPLDSLRDWLTDNNAVVMAVLLVGDRGNDPGEGAGWAVTRVLIRLDDEVTEELLSAFPHLTPAVRRAQTTLTGDIVDQEELQGVLNYLSQMGVRIIDVVTIPDPDQDAS